MSRWEGLYFDSYDPWEHLDEKPWELNDFGEAVPVDTDYEADMEDEFIEDDGSYVMHRYDIVQTSAGPTMVYSSTNDNLDYGYPTETAFWDQEYRTFEDAVKSVNGPSRYGFTGCRVEVTLNGKPVNTVEDFQRHRE